MKNRFEITVRVIRLRWKVSHIEIRSVYTPTARVLQSLHVTEVSLGQDEPCELHLQLIGDLSADQYFNEYPEKNKSDEGKYERNDHLSVSFRFPRWCSCATYLSSLDVVVDSRVLPSAGFLTLCG